MKESEVRKRFLLQPQFLSQTLAIFWGLVVFIITMFALILGQGNLLTKIFSTIYPFYSISITGLFIGFISGWFHGFIQGTLIGWIYKWLVNREREQLLIPGLEDAARRVVVLRPGSGDKPYTIVFVANPVIKRADDAANNFEPDPIMRDRLLFATAVRRSIRSVKENELLGIPAFYSRLRIIVIFDPTRVAPIQDNALCEEHWSNAELLAPRFEVGVIRDFVRNTATEPGDPAIDWTHIDVIYVVSASRQLIQSAARWTEDPTGGSPKEYRFTFGHDTRQFVSGRDLKAHPKHAEMPGVVGLSALDDRPKTAVHEFAHAMSSRQNGFIDDEYVDDSQNWLENRINKKTRTPYKVTDVTLAGLEEEGMPEPLRNLLSTIEGDDPETGNADFLKKLRELLPPSDFAETRTRRLILAHADQTEYMITEQTLHDLNLETEMMAGEITALRENLLNQKITGRAAFLKRIRCIIGEARLLAVGFLIVRYARWDEPAIPQIFSKYKLESNDDVVYYSERERGKPRDWTSYVCRKASPDIACTMDISASRYQFDPLIIDFMYDRLHTKITR